MSMIKGALGRPVPHEVSGPATAADEQSPAGAVAGKRRRLAKAFARPLDKKLRDAERVRVTVSVRAAEYAQLVALQRRLAELGVRVKKSALLCAGLQRLARFSDEEFLGALSRLPPID